MRNTTLLLLTTLTTAACGNAMGPAPIDDALEPADAVSAARDAAAHDAAVADSVSAPADAETTRDVTTPSVDGSGARDANTGPAIDGSPPSDASSSDVADASADASPPDTCAMNPDPIDPNGTDTNCDGVDGVLAQEVFVATTGADTNTGTPQAPFRTIGAAIHAAQTSGKSAVLVASGSYTETVTLVDGVSLYGGYGAAYNTRSLASTVVTSSAGSYALAADSIATVTIVQGIHFVAPTAATPGGNSIAAHVHNSPMLTIEDATLESSNAGDGTSGATGAAGAAGGSGRAGNAAVTCSSNPCPGFGYGPEPGLPGSPGCMVPGATTFHELSGGSFGGYPGFAGAGSAGDTGPAENGDPGNGPGSVGGRGGAPGSATYDAIDYFWIFTNGATGGNGPNGPDGPAGTSQFTGLWSSTGYAVPVGSAGTDGFAGSGGGGGGGSIGMSGSNATSATYGSSGSGGGAGGCGGSSGQGSTGGGASVALFLDGASPQLNRVTITTGRGGSGGVGGAGGMGGIGGAGGPAVPPPATWMAGSGAAGGSGGNGGHGGAGGCSGGGPSYGIVVINGNSANTTNVTYNVGSGGSGAGACPAGASNALTIAPTQP